MEITRSTRYPKGMRVRVFHFYFPLLVAFLIVALCPPSFANPVPKNSSDATCGVFRVEGVLRESVEYPQHLELVTDHNSRSERRFVLGEMPPEDLKVVKNLRVAGKLRVLHFCFGECFGEWLGTERLLAPDEEAVSFSAAPASIRLKRETCFSDSMARKRVLKK